MNYNRKSKKKISRSSKKCRRRSNSPKNSCKSKKRN